MREARVIVRRCLVHARARARGAVAARAGCRTRSRSGSTTPRAPSASGTPSSGSRASSPPPRGRPVPAALRNGGRADRLLAHEARRARRHDDRARPTRRRSPPRRRSSSTTAAASSGCETPYIALNELNGASTTTPWTATNARYRQNVLDLLRALQAAGRAAVPARQLVPVHRRRRGRLVAAGGAGRRHRPRGLLQRAGRDAAGRDPRQPADADDAARGDRRLHGDRDPRVEARLRARLPVRPRRRRPRRAPAVEHVVPVREAVHARGQAGRGGVRRRDRLVVGVGDVQRRGSRPRQAGGRVRLPLDARPVALRRAGRRGARASRTRGSRARSRSRRARSARSTAARSGRPTSRA